MFCFVGIVFHDLRDAENLGYFFLSPLPVTLNVAHI